MASAEGPSTQIIEEEGVEIAVAEEAAQKLEVHKQPDDTNEEEETFATMMMLNRDTSDEDQLHGFI